MKLSDNLEGFKDFEFIDPALLIDAELELELEETCPNKPEKGYVPEYKFALVNSNTQAIMGRISLRVGLTKTLNTFGGHIGYEDDKLYRGNKYAARSCRLLFPLIRRLGIKPVVITCYPDNIASVKTIESLGGTLISTQKVEIEPGAYRPTNNYHLYI
jgi:tagatose 1,6-diphosphate aldolase